MSNKIIVLVVPQDDKDQGEVTVLENRLEAEQLIEGLLQSDMRRDQIKVFNCYEMPFNVTYRPVVALSEESKATESTAATVSSGHNSLWNEYAASPSSTQTEWDGEQKS